MSERTGGREAGIENVEAFREWTAERVQANDWADYVHRSQLNRTEIARECGFALSSFRSNPGLKKALHDVEEELQQLGVFGSLKETHEPPEGNHDDKAVKGRVKPGHCGGVKLGQLVATKLLDLRGRRAS
jgi:hypothetical protein